MSKKIIILDKIENIEEYSKICDGFIVGIKDLSVNLPNYFSLEELDKIIEKSKNKEIFLSINKNIHNKDIHFLKETLEKIKEKNINGIIYYDIALVNLNEIYNYNLIWNQEHMTTNYNTINYWYEKKVKSTYISSELSKEEVLEIKNNTKSKIFMNVFGYIPMFTSKRPLVKNYLEKFNLKDNSKINYMEKENKYYPIIDNKLTTVYSSKILNLSNDYNELQNIDYLVFNPFNIDKYKFIECVKLFNENDNMNNFQKINEILDNNTDTGFMYKETIYKVRDKI